MKQIIALCTLLLITSSLQAGTLIGIKSGTLPVSGAISDPHNTTLLIGYEMGIGLGDIGIEGEFSRTGSSGRMANGDPVEVETNAVYATYRSPGAYYLLAKGGMISGEITIGGQVRDDFNASYGVGFGISSGRIKIEWEYTRLDSDIDYVSIGVRF